ncbi:hypothetical protein ACFQZC_31900 [Streptacidiphilus monticola]
MSDERGATTPGRAAARKAARRRQRRRTRRVVVWSVAGIVLLCFGAGYYEYQSLNSKLSGSSLHASGDSATGAPQEIVDRFGRSPSTCW